MGDTALRNRLKKDHGRKELRLAKIFSHGDIDGASTGIERFKGDFHRELQACEALVAESIELLILGRNGESVTSHQQALADHNLPGLVEEGRLSAGWRDQDQGLVVVHDFELAHRQPNRRKARTVSEVAVPRLAQRFTQRRLHRPLKPRYRSLPGYDHPRTPWFYGRFPALEFAEESRTYLPVSAIDLYKNISVGLVDTRH